jgi:hypothetical protein
MRMIQRKIIIRDPSQDILRYYHGSQVVWTNFQKPVRVRRTLPPRTSGPSAKRHEHRRSSPPQAPRTRKFFTGPKYGCALPIMSNDQIDTIDISKNEFPENSSSVLIVNENVRDLENLHHYLPSNSNLSV